MEIFDGHRALFRPLFQPAIALGNFDGVHLGHQRLLRETVNAAHVLGGDGVVLTFEPHPAQVLASNHAPPLLTTHARKLELIADHGISACIVEPFTRELARLDPDEFLQSIIVDIVGARHVVVGYDFTYGRNRAGTPDTLRTFGRNRGFAVQVIDPVMVDDVVASSTMVRKLVQKGDLAGVHRLLGRNLDVDGTVVPGEGRGRTMGVPTANVAGVATLLPAPGVYAVRVRVLDDPGTAPGRPMAGVANLGTNPTFGDQGDLSLEIHLLDFSGDLYNRSLRIEFVQRLRGEQRFEDVSVLVRQIHSDIAQARQILDAASLS